MIAPLITQGLTVRLDDRTVLDSLGARFEPAQVTCIVGPNGAGKSTLLACLAGLRRPDGGEALMGDEAVLGLGPAARAQRIGFLPQTPEIAWSVDVRTLVGLGRTPHLGVRGPGPVDAAAVDLALRGAGVEAFSHRVVNTLSGGERARVLIARALAGEPEWLLADEPLTGLDPGHQLDICGLFARLAHDEGRGVILTLHDLSAALRVADRILVMAEGRVLALGPPREVLTPQVIAEAYGVRARLIEGEAGPLVEVLGRATT